MIENNNCESSTVSDISKSTNKMSLSISNKLYNINNSSNNFNLSTISSFTIQNNKKDLFKSNQNDKTDETENNSCSFIISPLAKSAKEHSKLIINICDNPNKSLNKQSPPENQSEHSTNFNRNQNISCDLAENNPQLAAINSTVENILSKTNKSDDVSNSRSIFNSSRNENIPENHTINQADSSKNYFNILDSESDEDIIDISKSEKKLKIKNKRELFDSDYDKKTTSIIQIDENSEFGIEKNNKNKTENFKKFNKINNLIDSDSESDNNNYSKFGLYDSLDEEIGTQKPKKGKIKLKKRMESVRVSKELAMQKIHSETQRLIRESKVSLPYHRPKQRTWQEFWSRRKITSDIPKNLTCAEKVKMFPEMISKVVEEKEKEAEMFYKSSDSEEDEKCSELIEVNQMKVTNKMNDKSKTKDEFDNKITIKNTQKLTQDDIQESHIKKEICQKQLVDFIVPRKLFMDDVKGAKESESVQDSLKGLNKKENLSSNNLAVIKKKCKEVKTELKEYRISEKLFPNNSKNIDIDVHNNESILEQNLINNQKLVENDQKRNPLETIILENSAEEIVLNISGTDLDNNENEKVLQTSILNNLSFQSQNQENTISEIPIINNNGLSNINTISRIPVRTIDTKHEIINLNESTDFSFPFTVNESSKKLNIKEKILANVLKLKPIIKGSPGSIIDFAISEQINEGVIQLLNRFTRHSIVVKPKVEGMSEVKIISTDGEGNNTKVTKETLLFKRSAVEDEENKEHKPGEKLKKLREDLKRRIATVRFEEWKQKEEYEKEDEELKDESDSYYAGLPDEEQLLEDEKSSESEPEENDVLIVDKPKLICEFADEEAEETDNEYVDDSSGNEENNEEQDEKEVEEDDYDIGLIEYEENKKVINKPKKLKRIIKPFEDNSSQLESSLSNDANLKLLFDRTKTDEDIFASQTSNGYVSEDIHAIPPFQPRDRCNSDSRSQACKTPLSKSNNILSMISPVAQLTALNASLESIKKSTSKTNNINFGQVHKSCLVSNTLAQNSCNLKKMINLPKKLFDDPPETVNDDELLDICSGKFIETQNSERNKHNEVTDTQLMELCSGAFISQPIDMKKLEFKYANSNIQPSDDTSQDITLTLDDENNDDMTNSPMKMSSSMKRSDESMFSSDSKSPVKVSTYNTSTCKNLMETWLKRVNGNITAIHTQLKQNEVTDSQLIDLCSGVFALQPIDMKELKQNETQQAHSQISQDFMSTLNDKSKNLNKESKETINKQKELEPLLKQTIVKKEKETAPWLAYMIVSSDDDDLIKYTGSCVKTKKHELKKKKKVQKLMLSDDEENKSNDFSEDEEDDTINEEEKYIEYDSDENEIVVVNKKEIKKVAANFLEKEAELSESDWDSADEDEQDMDKFEYEEGDIENIDENKMKKILDKIHIKQMMDKDQREVKILQEFLFDDGDLHNEGAGREKRFKWKNIDNTDDNLRFRINDDDEIDDGIDTAVEAQMRKIRYEQQKFLEEKEKNINENVEKDFEENHSFKLGLKVISLRSSRKSSLENPRIKGTNLNTNQNFLLHGISNLSSKTVTNLKNSSFTNMRGSFLSRGEETLVRIAQNLPETNKKIINPLRNRKFVFEHLSPSVSNVLQEDFESKNDITSTKEKKKVGKRKTFLSQKSPTTTKKLKVDDRTSYKQLF